MAENTSVEKTVSRLPDPDKNGLLSNIDKEVVDSVTTDLLRGEEQSIRAVIDMLVEPGRGDDVKPHYALHCCALRVCALGGAARERFSRTLASYLGGDKPKGVQKYLIQELQTAGGPEVVPQLGQMLLDDDCYEEAAMALTAIKHGAAEQFNKALPKVKGKARQTVAQNLELARSR